MEDIVFSKYTEDFARAALDYCVVMEKTKLGDKKLFVGNMVRILPLLYLKASIIPPIKTDCESELGKKVTMEMYDSVRESISNLLGEDDLYLETFHPDIKLSDSPVAVKVSEDLVNIYQELGNFIAIFKNGQKKTMTDSLALSIRNFEKYWGQRLLNALRALHFVKYNDAGFAG
jgi:hypothetical protein